MKKFLLFIILSHMGLFINIIPSDTAREKTKLDSTADTTTVEQGLKGTGKIYLVAIYRDAQAAKCIQAVHYYKKNFDLVCDVVSAGNYRELEKGFYYVVTKETDSREEAEKEAKKLEKFKFQPKIFELTNAE